MSHSHGIALEAVLSAPSDVYSLRLVLCAVAEERCRGMRTPVWRDGKTPDWYRDVAKGCLVTSPIYRTRSIIDLDQVLTLPEPANAAFYF